MYISHLKHNLIRTSHILSDQYHKWLVATILDRVVPYHDCGGGYTTVYFCQNSLNHTLSYYTLSYVKDIKLIFFKKNS